MSGVVRLAFDFSFEVVWSNIGYCTSHNCPEEEALEPEIWVDRVAFRALLVLTVVALLMTVGSLKRLVFPEPIQFDKHINAPILYGSFIAV